ncbi:MAG: type II secretion system GspH family protein [Myxococcota bacterium]|nr:type II secretion system GspH family protein [Myxococcota bacterium]
MVQKLKNLKRGFTLVELMIVVAIVGILAALAVYGVSKYVKNAKTAEARDALGRMAKDAVSAYNKESMDVTTVLAAGSSSSVIHTLCADASAVPTTIPAAAKYQSAPNDWSGGWDCLHFSMNEPQYFQYEYTSESNTSFSCIARGDLDGDTSSSTFSIAGAADSTTKTATYAPTIAETSPEE